MSERRAHVYTRESLIDELRRIAAAGYIPNARPNNHGGVGNTLEDLLGIPENNIPEADASGWEIKAQRNDSDALLTLFHKEPSPRAQVPRLCKYYGWPHQTLEMENSFRQTINARTFSGRGFKIKVDNAFQIISLQFDSGYVDSCNSEWLKTVEDRVGLGSLGPEPQWAMASLKAAAKKKINNLIYIDAERRRENAQEHYSYSRALILHDLNFEGLVLGLGEGWVYIDFDARTHHNHGTKVRVRKERLKHLYRESVEIMLASSTQE